MIEFFAFLVSAAWLVPNSYFPWLSAWSDGAGIFVFLLMLVALAVNAKCVPLSQCCIGVAALCITMPFLQLSAGKLSYLGDAIMVALYVGLWLAAVLAGSMLTISIGPQKSLDWLLGGYVVAAVLSVGIALVQWTGAFDLGFYGLDLPSGVRAVANLGQPNLFNTACFIGLCSVLFLHQRCKLSTLAFCGATLMLLWGMVLSQSRTGWIQIFVLVAWGLYANRRVHLRINRIQLLAMGAAYLVGTLLLSTISAALFLPIQRSFHDQMQTGVRFPYWLAMIDAIGLEPIWGYGWQQVGAAQQRVALDHPAFDLYFAHSHNFALDLLLWNGVPFGGLIIGLLGWWFITRIRACQDARGVWMLAFVGGVVIHGMLEFPLEYAYFLIPVGIAMGAVDGFANTRRPLIAVPRWAVLTGSAVLSAAFVITAMEYLEVEQNYRTQQLEMAKIGVDRLVTPVPELHLLTQLDALLKVAHIEPTRAMNDAQLGGLKTAALRFGFPLALQRYAQALALNGNPEEARRQIQLLRSMWGEKAYVASKKQLLEFDRVKYPEFVQLALP